MKPTTPTRPAIPIRAGAWLCSLALAWACTSDDADTGGDASTVATASASTGGTGADPSSPSGPGDDGDGGSQAEASGDSTATPGTDGTDSGTGGPPACQPEPAPDICQAAHDHWVVCIYGKPLTDESYLYDCSCRLQFAASEFGPACVAVLEDWYACVAQAECMEIVIDEHCDAQYSAIQAECTELSPP
jgi:hypothetical protein